MSPDPGLNSRLDRAWTSFTGIKYVKVEKLAPLVPSYVNTHYEGYESEGLVNPNEEKGGLRQA